MKINVNEMTMDQLLELSHKLHFEICALTSLLRKQAENKGMKLKTMRKFRTLTIESNRLDLHMRTLTKQVGDEIHNENVKKWTTRKAED